MLARVQKWGNSLAVRLPKAVAEEADIRLDSPVNITVQESAVVIQPVRERRAYDLERLLAGVTEENLHGEEDFGAPVGREAW